MLYLIFIIIFINDINITAFSLSNYHSILREVNDILSIIWSVKKSRNLDILNLYKYLFDKISVDKFIKFIITLDLLKYRDKDSYMRSLSKLLDN